MIRTPQQRYALAHRVEILARKRAAYAEDSSYAKSKQDRWRAANPEKHRFSCYKQHAKARHVEFALTFEQACAFMRSVCVYCGRAPLNGIDRMDPDRGYTADNCEPACTECNLAKGVRTKGEFLAWLLRVAPRFGR